MQYEGAIEEGGRTPSIWDSFTHAYPGLHLNLKFMVFRKTKIRFRGILEYFSILIILDIL